MREPPSFRSWNEYMAMTWKFTWRFTMKALATIAGLLIATGMALSTSAAIAVPLQSASLHDAAAPLVQTVKHHRSHTAHRRVVAPISRDYGDGAYSYAPGHGVDDWSHWSPTHHPGWPCVSGPPDETSAYPSWEVGPGCR
jgi:hypothetical protein